MKTSTAPGKFKAARTIPPTGPIKDIASGRAEVFKLDPRLITRQEGFNARYDYGDIAALANDIDANGVLESLKVRKEGSSILLINGHRRLTAIELLMSENRWPEDPSNPGYPTPVPCTSEGKNIAPADRIFMMLSLNTGKPFTMLEKAIAYQQAMLADPSITGSEIARRTGETKQAVSNALQIINQASPLLLEHIRADKISATAALGIIKSTDGHDAQNAALNAALAQAKESGKDHALPKHVPKKPPTPASDPPSSSPDHNSHNSPSSDPEPPTTTSTPPPDPGAYERLKSASSSNRDGSSASSGPGSGYAAPEKRIKAIETMLDELNADACHQERWATIELILDYLPGNHTIATIKSHLKKSA